MIRSKPQAEGGHKMSKRLCINHLVRLTSGQCPGAQQTIAALERDERRYVIQ